MKFFIAITLFAVVSALPQPRIIELSEDETPPIVFRHWEPTPDLRIGQRPNAGLGDLSILKELLSRLPNPSEADYVENRDEILNALKNIYEIVKNKGRNDVDEEADTPTNDGSDDGQGAVLPINSGLDDFPEFITPINIALNDVVAVTPINDRLDANQEGERSLNDDSAVDIIKPDDEIGGARNGDGVSEIHRLVDFMPKPLQLVSRSPQGLVIIDPPVGGIDKPDEI